MASGATSNFKIQGADEVFKNLRLLPEKLREQVAWPATIAAMEYAKEIAKENAMRVDRPWTRNYIPDNIAIAQRRKLGAELKAAYVSLGIMRRAKGQGGGQTFYWWFVELGTSKTRAQPFLRPVINEQANRLLKEFVGAARLEISQLRF